MSLQLFTVAKVQAFCDAIAHSTEDRRGDTVKIVELSLRVHPFDGKLATSFDEGLQNKEGIKPVLFSLNSGEPKKHVKRCSFAIAPPRQTILVYASTDTVVESIALAQVKISDIYVRTQKDVSGYALCFKASFGPVSKTELEYIEAWRLTARALSFEEAEKSIEFEDAPEASEADQKSRKRVNGQATLVEAPDNDPEWEDDGTGSGRPVDETPAPAAEPIGAREHGSRRKLHSHQSGKKKTRGDAASDKGKATKGNRH